MPTICRFDEISVKMNKEGGVQHKRPHIHAYYKETSASFDIETGEIWLPKISRMNSARR